MPPLDDCPKCQSSHIVKVGFAYDKQRHRCKNCYHHFTVLRKSNQKDDTVKKMAVDMYLKGLDFRAIARVLGIGVLFIIGLKHLALNIKTLNNTNLNQNDKFIDRVELDEIHSDTKLKKLLLELNCH